MTKRRIREEAAATSRNTFARTDATAEEAARGSEDISGTDGRIESMTQTLEKIDAVRKSSNDKSIDEVIAGLAARVPSLFQNSPHDKKSHSELASTSAAYGLSFNETTLRNFLCTEDRTTIKPTAFDDLRKLLTDFKTTFDALVDGGFAAVIAGSILNSKEQNRLGEILKAFAGEDGSCTNFLETTKLLKSRSVDFGLPPRFDGFISNLLPENVDQRITTIRKFSTKSFQEKLSEEIKTIAHDSKRGKKLEEFLTQELIGTAAAAEALLSMSSTPQPITQSSRGRQIVPKRREL